MALTSDRIDLIGVESACLCMNELFSLSQH